MSELDKNAAPTLLPADSVVIALDLEGLGKPPAAPVLKIGISASAPGELEGEIGHFFYERIGLSLSAAMKLGPIDPDVLQWWMRQSDFARRDAFLSRGFDNIESAAARLARIMQEIRAMARPLPCWLLIKRPQYDLPLLENFLRAGGQDPAEVLGSFRAVIDFATEQLRFQWLAQQFLPPEQVPAFMHVECPPYAEPHTALGDAFYQIICLRTWERRLKALAATIKISEGQ